MLLLMVDNISVFLQLLKLLLMVKHIDVFVQVDIIYTSVTLWV